MLTYAQRNGELPHSLRSLLLDSFLFGANAACSLLSLARSNSSLCKHPSCHARSLLLTDQQFGIHTHTPLLNNWPSNPPGSVKYLQPTTV